MEVVLASKFNVSDQVAVRGNYINKELTVSEVSFFPKTKEFKYKLISVVDSKIKLTLGNIPELYLERRVNNADFALQERRIRALRSLPTSSKEEAGN